MKFFYMIFGIFFSVVVHAQNTALNTARIFVMNPEMRFERADSQEILDRKPLNFSVAYKRINLSVGLEYSRFQESTGNSTSNIERIHQDYLLWFKYHFLQVAKRETSANLFAGAGAGCYDESVTTSFMSTARTDKNGFKFTSGLAVGGEIVRTINQYFDLLFAVEGRTLFSAENDPNPLWSGVLRFGIQVPF